MKHTVFSFLVLSISFLAFGFFLRVPSANAACTSSPTILYNSSDYTGGVRSVVYHIRLKNNCAGAQDIRIRVSSLPNVSQNSGDFVPNRNIQDRLHANWKINNNAWDEPLVIENVAGNSTINVNVTVKRDIEYYHPDGNYGFVKIRAALVSNTSYNDTRSVIYVVQNRPDLTVTKFEFPGGPTCETTNAIVRIRNLGWKSFSGDFDVRVFNGNGNNGRTFRVTQFVDAREFINLDSRFRNMNLPPVGRWTARAVVDLNNEILEENEKDNEESVNYRTTPCITPTVTQPPATPTTPPATPTTPPATPTTPPTGGPYTISGGIFLDEEGGITGRKDSTENYTDGTNAPTGTINISGKSYLSGASGFTSDPLPAGEYRVYFSSYPAIKEEYSLTYPSPQALIDIPYIIVKVGPECTQTSTSPVTCASGNAGNVNFGISLTESAFAEPWIQGVGGDMRVDWEMRNIIPNTSSYFSQANTSLPQMTPGVVFDGINKLNLGEPQEDKVSENKWIVKEVYDFPRITTSYSIMHDILNRGGVLEDALPIGLACGGPIANCILGTDLANGVYISTLDQEVIINNSGSYTFPNNKNFIFLIKGDLTIRSNIVVPKGSSVLFIVGGDITVADNVTILEGVYSADGFFTVEACGCVGDDKQLTIGGSVIANAGKSVKKTPFINNRNLGSANDNTPAVKFIYRPDFVLNMPQLIRYKSYSIREVAPGSRIN